MLSKVACKLSFSLLSLSVVSDGWMLCVDVPACCSLSIMQIVMNDGRSFFTSN